MVFFPCGWVKSWLWVLAPCSPSVELPCSWPQQAWAGSARQEFADWASRAHYLGVHRLSEDIGVCLQWVEQRDLASRGSTLDISTVV